MAHRAILGGWNVSGIGLGIFAGRYNAIVARRAVINDTGMIEHRRRKGTGNVTGTAVLDRCNMVGLGILAGCIDAVVAGIAPVAYNVRAGVVDKRIGKISRVMAYGAVPVCVLMNLRNGHPSGAEPNMIRTAVMARHTITGDTDMAKYRGSKCSSRMAIVTILIRR
jgi:hypothetical protein